VGFQDQRGGEAAHGQGLGTGTVDDLQLGGQDKGTGDLAAPAVDGAAGWRRDLWSAPSCRRLITLLVNTVGLQC
jgi:hypothetical protein